MPDVENSADSDEEPPALTVRWRRRLLRHVRIGEPHRIADLRTNSTGAPQPDAPEENDRKADDAFPEDEPPEVPAALRNLLSEAVQMDRGAMLGGPPMLD